MKINKFFALLLTAALFAGVLLPLAGCGEKSGEVLRVWVYSDEYSGSMDRAFKTAFTAVEWGVEYTTVSVDDLDRELEKARETGTLPDIIMLAPDNLAKYVGSSQTADLGALGLAASEENCYPYTVADCIDGDGVCRAVCWQPDPVLFFYRRSMAYAYLGTDDPEEISSMISNWEGFLDTARLVKNASNGATRMTAGIDELIWVYLSGRGEGWFTENGSLNTDGAPSGAMELAKLLYDEKLTYGFEQWSEGWAAGISDSSSVFGYFTSAIGMVHILKAACGGDSAGKGSYGDWGAAIGPSSYNLGGCWFAVMEESAHKKQAALFLSYFTAEQEAMRRYCLQTGQFSPNRNVVEQIKFDPQFGELFLSGQNYYYQLAKAAELIPAARSTPYDRLLTIEFISAAAEYASGESSKEKAMSRFITTAGQIVG